MDRLLSPSAGKAGKEMLKKESHHGAPQPPLGVLLASWVPHGKAVENLSFAVRTTSPTARCAWIWWIASCSAKLGQWLKTEKCCEQRPGGGGSFSAWFKALGHFFILVHGLHDMLVDPSNFATLRENTTGHWPCLLQLCHLEGAAGKRSKYTSFWKVYAGWWWPTWVRPFHISCISLPCLVPFQNELFRCVILKVHSQLSRLKMPVSQSNQPILSMAVV